MNELEWKIAAAIERGQHVTTANIGGMTFAIVHEPTDEARAAAIKELKQNSKSHD